MWSEWLTRTLKPRPVEDAAAEDVSASPLTLASLTRQAPPSPLVEEGRGEGEGAPVLIDIQCD